MDSTNALFLIGGLLLFVSVIASRLSARIGMPLLLIFLVVGMLAGEDGIGGIEFDSFSNAAFIGQLALAIILLDGGLRTRFSFFRIALKPAAMLATWGVIATVLLLSVFATYYMGIDWKVGILMAAIVGSTDAAAVFSLLRSSGVRLNSRVQATLEIESGANDPMAIFLVSAMITVIMQPEQSGIASFLTMLAQQMSLGLVLGLIGGKILTSALRRVPLAEGLYALLIASGGLFVFALTNLIGGSGFLAVYIAGIMIGNYHSHATEHVLRVMDGLAWLAQASMFLVLGLLVTPSRLIDHGFDALMIAAFLILVARPLAVFSGLAFFKKYSFNEKLYISWVGLRGAVPVTLAIMPLMMDVPGARLLFDVAFAVVILSLLIQGSTIPYMAKKLKVVLPQKAEPKEIREVWLENTVSVPMLSFNVVAESVAEGTHPDTLIADDSLRGSRCFALIRDNEPHKITLETRLQANDTVWYITPLENGDFLAELFNDNAISVTANRKFFGEFEVNPSSLAGDLASAYGLSLRDAHPQQTLSELFDERFQDTPVVGDRIEIGDFILVIKEQNAEGNIKILGLKCPE